MIYQLSANSEPSFGLFRNDLQLVSYLLPAADDLSDPGRAIIVALASRWDGFMRAPVLKIRKKVLEVQGQMRPCVQVQAIIDERAQEILEKDFSGVILFKRTLFSNGIPDRVPQPEAMLYPHLANFIKSDTCPEISVKASLQASFIRQKIRGKCSASNGSASVLLTLSY